LFLFVFISQILQMTVNLPIKVAVAPAVSSWTDLMIAAQSNGSWLSTQTMVSDDFWALMDAGWR